jgi:hypothetical protein
MTINHAIVGLPPYLTPPIALESLLAPQFEMRINGATPFSPNHFFYPFFEKNIIKPNLSIFYIHNILFLSKLMDFCIDSGIPNSFLNIKFFKNSGC